MKTGLAKSLWCFGTFVLLFILAAGLIGTPQARAQDACDPTSYYYIDTFTEPDGPAAGWTTVSGTWGIENGEYNGSIDPWLTAYTFITGTDGLSDYKVEVSVFPIGPDDYMGWRAGLIVRANPHPGSNGYDGYLIHTYSEGLRIYKLVDEGVVEWIYGGGGYIPTNAWHTLGVEAKGNELKFYYNGALIYNYIDNSLDDYPPFSSGMTGLRVWGHSGPPHVHFDNFKYCGPTLTKVVAIDIKPGSFPNSINLRSAGVTPVAIISDPTFDATQVDPATVSLAGAQVKLIGKGKKYSCGAQDINGDGLLDLVCHVLTAQFSIEPGSSVAVLEAKTFGGQAIRGEDSINIVP
jgi:hypothetical protein